MQNDRSVASALIVGESSSTCQGQNENFLAIVGRQAHAAELSPSGIVRINWPFAVLHKRAVVPSPFIELELFHESHTAKIAR